MGRNLKTCAWCHKPTSMPEVFAADTPLLEWFEEKIDAYCKSKNIIFLSLIFNAFSKTRHPKIST